MAPLETDSKAGTQSLCARPARSCYELEEPGG